MDTWSNKHIGVKMGQIKKNILTSGSFITTGESVSFKLYISYRGKPGVLYMKTYGKYRDAPHKMKLSQQSSACTFIRYFFNFLHTWITGAQIE